MNPQIITKKFQDKDFYFNFLHQDLYINATETAKYFGKKPDDWLRTKETKKYIEAVEKRFADMRNDLVIVKKGGKAEDQGTWIHKKLVIVFARWLSPEFAVWCDEVVEDILSGLYSLQKSETNPQEISLSEIVEQTQKAVEVMKLLENKSAFELFQIDQIAGKFSPTKLLKIDFSQIYFLPTEIGKILGVSGAEVNLIFEKKGFQFQDENGVWKPTEKGKEFCLEIGNRFNQLKWKLEIIL